jgi:hypothetical protein
MNNTLSNELIWPEKTFLIKKILFSMISFPYFLWLMWGSSKLSVRHLKPLCHLPSRFLLNLIRGVQFWIFHFTKQKCLWSVKSSAPLELKRTGHFAMFLSYDLKDAKVAGHASTEHHLFENNHPLVTQTRGL